MSDELVRSVRRIKLTKGERKLALLLADLMDGPHGVSWHSRGTLARMLDCGVSTVIRNRKRLVEMGLLRIIGQREIHRGYVPIYQFDMRVLDRLQPQDRHPVLDDFDTGPVGGHSVGGHFESEPVGGQNGFSVGGHLTPKYISSDLSPFDDGGEWVLDRDPLPLEPQSLPQAASSEFAENGQSQAPPLSQHSPRLRLVANNWKD